jgi:hypothetical protein
MTNVLDFRQRTRWTRNLEYQETRVSVPSYSLTRTNTVLAELETDSLTTQRAVAAAPGSAEWKLLSMELLLLLPCSVVVLSLAISAAQLASSLLVSSNGWLEGGGGVAAPMLLLLPVVVSSPPPSPVWTGSVGGRDSTSMLPSEITARDGTNEEKLRIWDASYFFPKCLTNSVVDPYWFQRGSKSSSGSGSRVLRTKIVKKSKFLNEKLQFFLSLGLHERRLPSYRRSLQPSKENIQPLENEIFSLFLFSGHFCPPGSGSSRLNLTWIHTDPCPQHWL